MMKTFKIACTKETEKMFESNREKFLLNDNSNFVEIAAIVINSKDEEIKKKVKETEFDIPIIEVDKIECSKDQLTATVEEKAVQYEKKKIPPFLKGLMTHYKNIPLQFDCPGHQNGRFFCRHPTGRIFYNFLGSKVFENDHCNADIDLGDLLIHSGIPLDAQRYAAKIYNADETFFVTNGSSGSNLIVSKALLTEGDLVLFDRNNHKSVYNGALVQCGAIPVYLETSRNPFGFIGGIYEHCFSEEYIRERIKKVCPEKANLPRPIRLAYIQLGTYDGTIYNAREVVKKIGKLCDYICFDSAWVGYEQFIPMMKDCSPLLINLKADDPGILVIQSVHKQQAGFSQASQIHKKDEHIRGQERYVNHKIFNNAFNFYTTTSPFYPLFASIDVNAKMHEGKAGLKMWDDCIKLVIEARKRVLRECKLIRPFVPPIVNGTKWEDAPTEEIAKNIDFFRFKPGDKWHSYEGYGENQYFVDPCKLMFTTPGINPETQEYTEFGIPAKILANYLIEKWIVCEKCDLNSILFLMTPAESTEKLNHLVDKIKEFEKELNEDKPLNEVLPNLCKKFAKRYKGYTLKKLCQEMHEFYKKNDAKNYQKKLFQEAHFPQVAMSPKKAATEFFRNHGKLVPLTEIVGKIALEGALPYPPGIFVIAPGERWTEIAQKYFLILQEGINNFPGFDPEIQGVYLKEQEDGRVIGYGYVLDEEKASK